MTTFGEWQAKQVKKELRELETVPTERLEKIYKLTHRGQETSGMTEAEFVTGIMARKYGLVRLSTVR